ncbi:hypothetical protein [Lactobacillus sp.]|uniref:hypothetical protein n=1 Tax=Lactobacillus sp. TaxID=1591 RepID=UPI003F10F54B
MKAIKQLYHEHKIITLILTSPIWLFALFSVLFTANEIYKSTQEGVVTEVLNKTLPQHGYSDIYYLNQVKADSHFGMGTTYVSSFSTKRTVKKNQALFAKSGKKIDKGDANLPYYKEVTVRRNGMGWKVTVSDSIGQEENSYSVK